MIEQILQFPFLLPLLFFIIALVYSSVGLGGGSSYTALMAMSGMSILAIPMVSLTLNLLVTTVGSYNFIRNGHAKIRIISPFLISSIPMAYVGGAIKISADIFYWILLISLLFVVARIYLWQQTSLTLNLSRKSKIIISLIAGGVLGIIAGIVGIGGGVYLVPLIIILGLGTQKQAAASGAIFIWLNSLSGLVSRLQYNSIDVVEYLPLIAAVLIGGWLGSFWGAVRFSAQVIEKVLGLVIIVAIIFSLMKLT